jgi:HSP20 family molecular chaperone IbpA
MFGELMRFNPSEELSNWHRDIDDLFSRFFGRSEAPSSLGNWVPRMETYRKDNEYVLRFDLPGVNPNDVQVQAEGNVLSISGERKSEEKKEGYQETFYGKFERTVALPQGIELTRLPPAMNMVFLRSMCRFRHSFLDARSRFRSSKKRTRSWNPKPRDLDPAF